MQQGAVEGCVVAAPARARPCALPSSFLREACVCLQWRVAPLSVPAAGAGVPAAGQLRAWSDAGGSSHMSSGAPAGHREEGTDAQCQAVSSREAAPARPSGERKSPADDLC